jgi:hypothetical protein
MFATLSSFVGTVPGSLGRPVLGPVLGWDPKENGALLIVL